MPQAINYSFSTAENRNLAERETTDLDELLPVARQLTTPKTALYTHPRNLDGYLDFYVLDDGSIEMEIMERYVNDFAVIDASTAEHVIRIAMTDERDTTLRDKLHSLQLQWLT